MRRSSFWAMVLGSVALLCVAWIAIIDTLTSGTQMRLPVLLTGVFVALLTPGLVGSWRRPREPFARAVVAVAAIVLASYLRLVESGWMASIGALVFFASPTVPLLLLVALDRDRAMRWRRATLPVALGVVMVALSPPSAPEQTAEVVRAASWVQIRTIPAGSFTSYVRQSNPAHVVTADALLVVTWIVWAVVVVALALGAFAHLVRVATPVRGRAAILAAGSVALAAALMQIALARPERLDGAVAFGSNGDSWFIGGAGEQGALAMFAFAGAFVAAVLVWAEIVRPRLGRRDGGVLVVAPRTDVLDTFVRATGDPSIELAYAREGGWVDASGHAVVADVAAGRARTTVLADGRPIVRIEHDVSLLAEPDLVVAAAATAGRALEAERLAKVALAELDDVQASASRLLGAADRASAELRDALALGPERMLAGVLAQLDDDPVDLERVHDGLREAVAEVRAIAHATSPVVVVDSGLAAGLEHLGATAPHRLSTVGAVPDLPLAAAVTVYLAAERGLADAPLTIRFDDDPPAARFEGWVGELPSLIVDRVAALRGTIDHRPGLLVFRPPERSDRAAAPLDRATMSRTAIDTEGAPT